MKFLMKKLACVVLIMAFFSLSACGGSGESPTEDLLTVAQQEFDYAVSNLTDAQNNLRDEISSAELMLETVTEKDVTDATVLGDLRTALDNSGNEIYAGRNSAATANHFGTGRCGLESLL